MTGGQMHGFLSALRTQRWDDHRYYHHSRINQSLHLVSAISFLFSYVMIFKDPAISALAGWLVAMTTRQSGHFFFEPKDYDVVNHASHEHKEEIKVGYNLRRKVVLLAIWALSPLPLYFDPTFFGVFTPAAGTAEFIRRVAEIWLAIGIGGVLFRTVQLFFLKDVQTGLVWATKILTDPFHDVKLYHKAPLALLRGELIDPGIGDRGRGVGRGRSRRGAAAHLSSSHVIPRRPPQAGFEGCMARAVRPFEARFRTHLRETELMFACGKQSVGDHLLEDRPLDRFVGQRRTAPPPAILLHGSSRGDETVGHRREIGLSVVEAENQASRSNPAQRQAFGAQIILQHPVVAGGFLVADRPDRGHVDHLDGQGFLAQALIQLGAPARSRCCRDRGKSPAPRASANDAEIRSWRP